MTEQEKRIEEMERDVEEALNVHICDDNGTVYGVRKTTSTPVIAARLINKGYRKADEVMKEIFDKLTETFIEMTAYGSDSTQHAGYYDYSIKIGDVIEIIADVLGFEYQDYKEHTNKYDFKNWLKKFGVEVEE